MGISISSRRSRHNLLLAGLLLILPGCTGTFETRPATLLIVSFVEANTPRLAIVEDTFLTANPTAERLRFLTASRRTLLAPAIAADVVDRAGARKELVVLSREQGNDFTANLEFFNLENIDPTNPTAFETSRSNIQDLATIIGAGTICLTDLQVTRDGRYAALLSDESACGITGFPAIYIIDLSNKTLIKKLDTLDIIPAKLFLDQENNRLFFTEERVGSTALQSFLLPDGALEPDPPVLSGTDQRAIAPLGDSLVVLQKSTFQVIDMTASPPEVSSPVPTTSSSRTLIPDVTRLRQEVVILGSNSLTVHLSPTDSNQGSTTVAAVSAILEPSGVFVYLLENGSIRIFDLLTFDGNNFGTTLRLFPLSELTNPGIISWALATLTSTSP